MQRRASLHHRLCERARARMLSASSSQPARAHRAERHPAAIRGADVTGRRVRWRFE